MQEAQINTSITKKGIALDLKTKDRKIKTNLDYPRKIWQTYNKKNFLARNLTFLLTLPLPLVANLDKITYGTAKPLFSQKFRQLMLKDIPSSTFEYKRNSKKIKKQFISTETSFSKQKKLKSTAKIKKQDTKHSDAVVLLSMGKDSLLSLAVSNEIGLKPTALYINDTVSPTENNLKIKFLKKLSKENKITGHVIKNSVEKLNDFETWGREEMSLNYAHLVTSFCFISLPLVNYYNSRYIILGNEKNYDFYLKNKGEKIYPSYDQTTEWTREQNRIIKEFTKATVFSIIRPITDLAVSKILHSRYPRIAKYQHSCYGLDASNRRRWCLDCGCCIGSSLFLTAFGINPKRVGLPKFFSKKYKKLFTLFEPKCETVYDMIFSRDQELISLLFAMRQGEKGYIIDRFKKHHLKEALAREDELRKKFFKIYPARIPKELKNKVLDIYKEELKELQ